MRLYRYATDNEHSRWTPGPPPENGFIVRDDYGNTDTYMVPVEPVDVRIVCDDCAGMGYLGNTHTAQGCGACHSCGYVVTRVVIVEDTE